MPEGSWRGVLLILAGSATVSMLFTGDSKHGGKEISWQEFQGQLLESGLVDRIIVSNKTTARIVLRQQAIPSGGDLTGVMGNGATISIGKGSGVDQYSYDSSAGGEQGVSGFDGSDRSSSSSSSSSSSVAGGGNDAMGNNNNSVPGSSPAKFMRYPRLGSPTSGYSPYHFAIGSVESFERKLEEAQRALNIHPRGTYNTPTLTTHPLSHNTLCIRTHLS